MRPSRLQETVQRLVKSLQKFVDRLWYPPLLGLVAALDNFVLVIPNDGLLISSAMLRPKRWLSLAINIAIGSTVGALLLAACVAQFGLPWIVDTYPSLTTSSAWLITESFFKTYGLYLVFAVAITPLMQQPAVILAALAHTPLYELGALMFSGRLIKYLVMAYVGSHAPKLLNRMWGIRRELEEVGIEDSKPPKNT